MAQIPTHIVFPCQNSECQKKIRIKIPAKSGIYSITCPYCGTVKKIKLKGLDMLGQTQDAVNPPDNSQKPPMTLNQDFFVGKTYKTVCPHCNKAEIPIRSEKPGAGAIKCPDCKGTIMLKIKEADNAGKPIADLGDDFYINQSYTVTCPHCKEGSMIISQESPGKGIAVCPKCKDRFSFTVRKPTEIINKSELLQLFRGKLILLRRGWLNKDYPLRDGKNIVGRYDESKVSDIAIKGDSTMSRQSVEIEVDHHDKGYSFKLTVKNAVNPVLHNNKPLAIGDSISLNFGDSIILGKTKFRFDKDA